jgi:hypothetical protein
MMKRFAVFAIAGPLIAAATLFLILLPVAGVLEGVPVEISTPVVPAYGYAVLAGLVVAFGIGLHPAWRVFGAAGFAGMVCRNRFVGRHPGLHLLVDDDEDQRQATRNCVKPLERARFASCYFANGI